MRTSALVGIGLAAPLPTIVALTSFAATPVMAGGGASGSGAAGGGDGLSGAGATGSDAGYGGNGGGGGGGGAGITGGAGGIGAVGGGGTLFPGGAGGTTPGADGQQGDTNSSGIHGGGGGGGGGAHGFVGSLLPSSSVVGGAGGAGGYGDYYGGGGGGGGYGAVITASGSGTLTANVTGGDGGAGGNAFASAGNGGTGATGLYFDAGAYNVTIAGTVQGGNGGAGGAGFFTGSAGSGGAGIVAANSTIILASTGSIVGGLSGDGVTRANAVTFAGGTNIFEYQAGGTVLGNVVAFSSADTFRLGGSTPGSFDVSTLGTSAPYVGFGKYAVGTGSEWTLTGAATSATPWTINGIAHVDGDISSSSLTTVNSGGVLMGTGTVGNTLINGGTLAPGNSIGTLTVNGNLTFTAASTYLVEVSPSASDRVNVTGTATLGGATVNASFAPGSYVTKQYTILNALDGRVGAFGPLVNTNLPSSFTSSLSYDANNAYLDLTLNYAGPAYAPRNANQRNVANAITNFFDTGGSIPVAMGGLTPAGLTQASGEIGAGSQQTTFDAINLFMGLLIDPFAAGRSDQDSSSGSLTNSYAEMSSPRKVDAVFAKAMPAKADPFAQRWTLWAAGFGGSQTTDGSAVTGSNTATSRIYGLAAGADYRLAPDTVTGFALSGGGTNFSAANSGSGRSDMFQAGAFVRHTIGTRYLAAAVSYAWQDVTTDRSVAGIDQLQARFNANAYSGRVEGGTRYAAPWIGIGLTPYAAVQATVFDLPSYSERALSSPGIFALNYGGKTVTSTRSELGVRTDASYLWDDAILTLRGRLAWAHEFNPDRSIAAVFQSLLGAPFVVNGAAQARDAALTTASAEMKWRNGFSLAGLFEGEFSANVRSYAGKGVLRYQW